MVSRRFTARIDPRPVRPARLSLLTSAELRVDGATTPSPDREQGPFADPQGPPDAASPRDIGTDQSTSADWITNDDGERVHWIDGFAYRPEVCLGGDIIDPWGSAEGTAPTPGTAPSTTLQDEIDVVPFLVEGVDKISLFGAPTDAVRQERHDYALRQLLACRSKQIESELWKGTKSIANSWGNKYLADSHVVLPEGNRLLGYLTALATLEKAIMEGTCSQQGMIHCRADTATMWSSLYLLQRVGSVLVTPQGTIVLPGSGYDGSAPVAIGGAVPSEDSAWAYATTVPQVFLSDVFPDQQPIERTSTGSNDLTTYAREAAAVTWGCLQVAVHVDHTTDITVTGS